MSSRCFFTLSWLLLGMLSIQFCSADQPGPHASLFGRVMCGYQGWFSTPADATGWRHYGFEKPGQCHIDLWPDLAEFSAEERHDTPLRLPEGRPAQVFSSANPATVRRHLQWARDHGIDGLFLQRFGASVRDRQNRAFCDAVLTQVRASAEATGRSFAVMYDLSGLRAGEIERVVMQDWKYLRQELRVLDSPAYQHHAGRPLVAVWGIGFGDARDYTLEECHSLLRFLRDNPEFGGLSVMAGVPWSWRTLDRDATADPQLHQVLAKADVISPWAVGRYHDLNSAARLIREVHAADAAWCLERGKDYLPVLFPGFSWANLMRLRGQEAPLNQVPRLGGRFLWHQARQRLRHGATMLYVAMFDEMDEATAIFKTTAQVPVGTVGFVTEPELPSDHYLWLTGQIGRALRREIPLSDNLPARPAP
jgi:hypothetical protein